MYNKKVYVVMETYTFFCNKSNTVTYICSNNDGENSLVSPAVFKAKIHIPVRTKAV